MDFDTIDWKKVKIILKLLKFNLPDAVEDVVKRYAAQNDSAMVQAGTSLLNKYHSWLITNFETPEMDIALRMLFDEYAEEREYEEEISSFYKKEKNNQFVDKVTKYLFEKI